MLVTSKSDFPGSLLQMRGSSLAQTWPWLLLFFVEACLVEAAHISGLLPDTLSLSLVPFTLVGLALSIFLGFRNNACYDRWWEGRKLWGALINRTRTIARQVMTLGRPAGAEFHAEMVHRTIAYTYALKAHLRTQASFDLIRPHLPEGEADALRGSHNVPQRIAHRMGERFRDSFEAGHIDSFQLVAFEQSLTHLLDIQGGCERIKNTPVPMSYTMLTHRITALYCVALPFGIVDTVGLLSPIVALIVSFAFLGLDAVGTQIEDPFEEDPNDLPLAALSRIIEVNLREVLGETDLPPMLKPVDHILP